MDLFKIFKKKPKKGGEMEERPSKPDVIGLGKEDMPMKHPLEEKEEKKKKPKLIHKD